MNVKLARGVRKLAMAACVAGAVAMAGCGGGGGSNVRPDPDIAAPDSGWTRNPNAHDIGEHWREDEAMAEALGVERGMGTTKAGLARAHGAAEAAQDASKTRLRNVAPAQMQVLGTAHGVSVGHWRDGPAGTLDIDFDWRGAPGATAAQRAATERAGREWARRVASERSTGTIPAGSYISIQTTDLDSGPKLLHFTTEHDSVHDGLLIFVFDAGPTGFSSGGPVHYCTPDGCETKYGVMAITDGDRTDRRVVTHEIGHVLGIAGLATSTDPQVRGYVDTENHTFNGPNAVRTNGGKPVPLQWIDSEYNYVSADQSGAMADDSHLGVCTSVMAYCSGERGVTGPSELDFAVLADLGYTLLSASEAAEPEVYGFGAWGQWSAWGTGVERQIDHESGADRIRVNAEAFGVAPGAGFADTVTEVGGNATWQGVLIGIDRASPDALPVLGTAALEIELANFTGEAKFDDLTIVHDGHRAPFRSTSLSYGIALEGNAFADTGGHIAGALYGPQHEEMAGVVDDDRPGIKLLGAFGGTRRDD